MRKSIRRKVLTSLFIAAFAGTGTAGAQTPFMKVVAADGSGDYTSLQEAINACPSGGARSFIMLKNGTYKEQITIPRGVTLSLIGESRDGAMVTHDVSHASGLDKEKTSTIYVEAFDFYGDNFTTQHTAGRNGGQAECITNSGDRMTLRNVAMKGNQDAVRFDNAGRTYMADCYIEGTVDYIYDSGVAVLDRCDIMQLWPGYVIAPGDSYVHVGRTQSKELCGQSRLWDIGIIIRDSRLLCNAANVPEGQSFLGRPWGKNSSAGMYIRCMMDKHISPAGFTNMSAGTKPYIGEYLSTDLDGNPISLADRIEWEFTDDQTRTQYVDERVVNSIYDPDFVFTLAGEQGARAGGKFDYKSFVEPAAAPSAFTVSGGSLSWAPSAGAAGYVIYKDGRYLTNVTETSFTDAAASPSSVYSLRTVSATGCLGSELKAGTTGVAAATTDDLRLITTRHGASWLADAAAVLYTTGGTTVRTACGRSMDFEGLDSGCYILKVTTKSGATVRKILINQGL